MKFSNWHQNAVKEISLINGKYMSSLELIYTKVLNQTTNDLFHADIELSAVQINELNNYLKEYLETDKPIAYIVGFEIFLEKKILVTNDVLIPRFETEELVLELIKRIKVNYEKGSKINILDVCCGSGVIGLSLFHQLKNEYEIELVMSDISTEAIAVAKTNSIEFGVQCQIIQSDLLNEIEKLDIKFDILVSNPPYIDTSEFIQDSVHKYEPHLALYADDNGLLMYKKLITKMNNVTKKKNIVGFEIGNKQANAINKFSKVELKKEFEIIRDINNNDRILILESNDS